MFTPTEALPFRHGGEPIEAGAALELEKEGFQLVIALVAGEQHAPFRQQRRQPFIAGRAGLGVGIGPGAQMQILALEGHAVAGAERGAEIAPLGPGRTPAVVEIGGAKGVAAEAEQMEEGDAVAAAGKGQQ